MSSTIKENDWVAVNLNAPDNFSMDDLHDYGITPDNTGLQSEDYYKQLKQIQKNKLFQNKDGSFNDDKFHAFYESALRSFDQFQNINYTQALLDQIESSPYDVFSLGDGRPIMDTSAMISRSRDINRTTHGLGNLFETGKPVFDAREVAQANKMRDENGNVLNWSPNDKGGFWEGLFRRSAALAQYEEDGTHIENGIEVPHKKGQYKLDENGDPYYELLGDKEIYNRETLHYWDTITRDDSAWNKLDFMDSDGLHKSIGGTIARTATTLGLYFIPGVGEYLGYAGAAIALSKTLPVLAKGINGIIGSNDGEFGRTMTEIENFADRFGYSQSRDVQGKFFSFENIGNIISSSAGQLFQQRMIANIPRRFAKNSGNLLQASKVGRALSLGYMASTSATDTYSIFKEAGADDATAGVAVLAVTAALFGLMNIGYFKNWLFANSWLDEDYALRNTMNLLIEENALPAFKAYQEIAKKPMSETARRIERQKLFKAIHDKVQAAGKKLSLGSKEVTKNFKTFRPTEHAIDNFVREGNKKGISAGMRASLYLSRMFNEGFEETLEEAGADLAKVATMGLDSMGVKVTEDGKELDFGLTGRDILSRYTSAFLGGAIGGAVFEGFNHWEGGPYDSLLEKSLGERLLWYERNGYGKEVRERVDKLYKQGKLGNKNLSATPIKLRNINGKDTLYYGQGNEKDNQNLFVYNSINAYLSKLDAAISRQDLFSNNKLYETIFEKLQEKRNNENEDASPEEKMFHFLEDLDTAKVLTLQQIGFLSVVKDDADKLSYEIIKLDKQIQDLKAKIRTDNKITDSNRSKEDELFKSNLYLKDLEDKLKKKREAWNAIVEGKRNGYYMGLAHVKMDPAYRHLYYDTTDKNWKNLQDGFIETGVENYCLNTRGLDYNKLTDEDLKQTIDAEYEALKKIEDEDGDRRLYDYHLTFARKFNPDIEAANATIKGRTAIPPQNLFVQEAKKYGERTNNSLIKNAIAALEEELKKKADDDSEKAALDRAGFIKTAIDVMFPDNEDKQHPEYNGVYWEKDILGLLSQLNDSISTGGFYSDISILRSMLMGKLIKSAKNKMEKDANLKGTSENPANLEERLNAIAENIISKFRNSDEILKQHLDEISEIDLITYGLNTLIDELNRPISEWDDSTLATIESGKDALENYIKDKYSLLSGNNKGSGYLTLLDKINDLFAAIKGNSPNIADKYKSLINYVATNANVSTTEAKKIIDDSLFASENLAEYAIKEQEKISPAENLIENLLSKFEMYSGVNLFNAMRLLQDREVLKARLENKEKFGLTESEERQLEMAISALRVITAVITGSTDGLNEMLNLSGNSKLVVTPQDATRVYDTQINVLLRRINALLDLSRENRKRTAKAQQETYIVMPKKRVQSLLDAKSINFDGDILDFESLVPGINTDEATLANAKNWEQKVFAFEKALSEKLHSIFIKYKQNDNVPGFVKILVEKFGNDVFTQNPGLIDNDEKTTITPYGNVRYLITRTILASDKFESLWKTATSEVDDLIPLYSQQYCTYENVASIIDYFEGYGLNDALNIYIQKNYPIKPEHADKEYITNRRALKNFNNTDGVGGVGKTAGVGYFTDKIIKMMYKDASSIASSVTEEATAGLHEALRLGKDNKPAITFEKLIETISTKTNKDGSKTTLFKLEDIYTEGSNSITINDDKLKEVLNKIDKNVINSLFNNPNGKKILHFDETGLLNLVQVIFLTELAHKFGFYVSGYGDSLQNKALTSKGNSSGIEDTVHTRTPSLTISMRSQCSGVTENTQLLQQILRNVRNLFYEDPSARPTTFSDRTASVLEEMKSVEGKVMLSHDSKTYSGAAFIKSDTEIPNVVTKMISFIKQFNENDKEIIEKDPKKKHKMAIVVDSKDTEKFNKYKNKYASESDDVEVVDFKDFINIVNSKNVQGREFDFVVIDKPFSENKFNAITDLYTMVTRAKLGAIVLDTDDVFENLGFGNNDKPSAAEATFGSTQEQKLAIYKDYIEWMKGLKDYVPMYKDETTSSSTTTQTQGQQQAGNDAVDTGSTPAEEPIEVQVAGVSSEEAEKLEKIKDDSNARIQHYIDELRDKDNYDAKQLRKREQYLKSNKGNRYSDADKFVSNLKDLDFDVEGLPRTIPFNITTDDQKKAYRTFVSIVSRGILNNNTPENRANFIVSAKKVLENLLAKIESEREIVTSIQLALQDKTGFFAVKEGDIYYCFGHNGEQYFIPIAFETNLENGGYENIDFEMSVPSFKVSTNGEMMIPFTEVLNEIDGLVLDEAGNVYIGIVYPDEKIRAEQKASKDPNTESERVDANKYIDRNSGKSIIASRFGSDTFDFGGDFFAVQWDGSVIRSANKQRYINDNSVRQTTTEVGIQEIVTFEEWLRVIKILRTLVYFGKDAIESDLDKAKLLDFFGEKDTDKENVFTKVGAPGSTSTRNSEANEAKVKRFRNLSNYRILNKDAVNGLTSALLRYALTTGKDTEFAKVFVNNFVKWLGVHPSNDDNRLHRKGIAIKFKDGEENSNLYYVLPITEYNKSTGKYLESGYTVLKYDRGWETVKTVNDTSATLNKLLGPVNKINITDFINKALEDVVNIQNLEGGLSNGSVIAFPVDAFTELQSNSEGQAYQIIGTFSVFETNLYDWLLNEGKPIQLNVDEITNFLKSDYIFKNNMYREIKGIHEAVPEGKGWIKAVGRVIPQKLHVDVAKIFQPIYQIAKFERMRDDDENWNKVKSDVEVSNDTNSIGPAIDLEGVLYDYNNDYTVITFKPDKEAKLNGAFLNKYCINAEVPNNEYAVRTYSLEDGTITVEDGTSIITLKLNEEGIDYFNKHLRLNIPSIIESNNGITINLRTQKVIIKNNVGAEEVRDFQGFVGVDVDEDSKDNNIYTIIAGGQEFKLKLNEINRNKINNPKNGMSINNVVLRGKYLGFYIDGNTLYYAYNQNGNIVITDFSGQAIVVQEITSDGTKVTLNLGVGFIDLPNSDSNFSKAIQILAKGKAAPSFNSVKVTDYNGIKVLLGDNSIEGQWLQKYTDSEIDPNKTYTLLAVTKDKLGVYERGNLDTFKWVSKGIEFNDSMLPNASKPQINADWSNPVERIKQDIKELNEASDAAWQDYTSDEEPPHYEFDHNDYIEVKWIPSIHDVPTDIIRKVYQHLTKNIINGGQITDLECRWIEKTPLTGILSVEYNLNDTHLEGKLIVEGKSIHAANESHLLSFEQAQKDLDAAIANYNDIIKNYESQLEEALPLSDVQKIEQARDILKAQVMALESLVDAFNNKQIPNVDLKILTEDQRNFILNYRKALINKTKSC